MSYQFYTLPQNTSGAANIPVSTTPTPLASLTIAAGPGNDFVVLRTNVGWRAQALSDVVTQVLFKIWRGAPVTGELVCSVQDGVERIFDYAATTDFNTVVSGLSSDQAVTFVLTAQTVDAGTQAEMIGPITYTAFGTNSDTIRYFQLPSNTVGGANIPLTQTPAPVAFVNVDVKPGQEAVIRTSIGWRATNTVIPKVDVLFKLWRGAPVTGTLIASADDSADIERGVVTSFSHVDSGFTAAQTVTYVLTAEVPDPNYTASIVGALTLTSNVQAVSDFFTLPQNTAGSAIIPIISTGTPLAALTVATSPNLKINLRAAVGWAIPSTPADRFTPVLFKIWRGAPVTGTLLYSALDSGESRFDYRIVTALAHVDSGFTASGPVTYILTAELTSPQMAANVVGLLTFTAVPDI